MKKWDYMPSSHIIHRFQELLQALNAHSHILLQIEDLWCPGYRFLVRSVRTMNKRLRINSRSMYGVR